MYPTLPVSNPIRDCYDNFVDGADTPPPALRYFDADNPSTGEHLCRVARSDAQDVEGATRNAAEAWPRWMALKPARRGQILLDVARAIRARIDHLAIFKTIDTGKPLSLARGDVETCARYTVDVGRRSTDITAS